MTSSSNSKRIANDVYVKYRSGGPVPIGECHIIAALVCLELPYAKPVGGYCSDGEDRGAHWWAEMPDGTVLDPLGQDWAAGGVQTRERRVAGVPALLAAMRSAWTDYPAVMELAGKLESRLKENADGTPV